MARILAAIGLVIAGWIPFSAGALGLGEIDLKSALNQPFSAEIPVVSEAPGDLEALRVEIAPVETFEQFGLDRPSFLSDFDFTVVVGADEKNATLQISSQKQVIEPFVTLLLEVSWPQGRLLREYTVLLDPPVYATESVAAAVSAPTAGPSTSTRAGAAPVQSDAAPAAGSSAVQTGQQSVSARSAADSPAPVTAPAAAAENEGGIYGPVKRNDTLWKIAGNMVGDSQTVTRNQMMLAIYQANPEAFAGNINRLKAGMILRVPSTSEVALNSGEATAEVRRQNQQWRSETGRPEDSREGQLRLVPPPDSDAESGVADQGAAPQGEDVQPGVGSPGSEALQGRVQELESQLEETQRQLQVRDQELEALQRQLAEISDRQEAEIVEPEFEPEAVSATPDLEAEAEPEPEPEPGEALLSEDIEAPVTDETLTVDAEEAAPAPVDVTPVAAQRPEESFLGALFTNPLVYISLVLVLLVAWLFTRKRSSSSKEAETGRWDALDDVDVAEGDDVQAEHEATTRLETQPRQDETFVVEEALPSAGEATDDGEGISPFADDSAEDWGGLVEESETPLERTISTDSAVNLDQADPIAESDFHMAYGLYDQAAELLTQAVSVEPDRKDLRMKLLEVFFIWENQEGFLREAEALQQKLDDDADPDWNKVMIMGKQICPDEALFSGESTPVGVSDSVDLEFGEEGGAGSIDIDLDDSSASSIDLEFDEAEASLDLELTGEQEGLDDESASDGLDFDLGNDDEVTQIASVDDLEISGDALTDESPDMDSTLESPTVESTAMMDSDSTMESPTIESPAMDSDSTMESPTIESPAMDSDSTMESPTIESPTGQWDQDAESGSDQTAEIELDDLDLDLSGLEEMDPDDFTDDSVLTDTGPDAEVSGQIDSGDDTSEQPVALDLDLGASGEPGDELSDDVDSTTEMLDLDEPQTGDTVEQPSVGVGGDTAEQPNLKSAVDDDLMLDVGEPVIDDEPTAEVGDSGVDGATMTEVGTKLDLARAYIDMGDPDGARSILNEVLEEAEAEQKQEAQKLLDDLVD